MKRGKGREEGERGKCGRGRGKKENQPGFPGVQLSTPLLTIPSWVGADSRSERKEGRGKGEKRANVGGEGKEGKERKTNLALL